MRFRDIVGNENVKSDLHRIADADKIPHALLFLGPKGSAKLGMALAFINYLACENKQDSEPCGQCSHCTKSFKFVHPDIHFSFPVIGSDKTSNHFLVEWRSFLSKSVYGDINQWMESIGADNKQANINKAECLNIIQKLSLKSFQSKYKFILIWLPEYLAKEGNRLLKLLEEPPENTIIIMVAEESEKILNTILSRCQLVKFNGFDDAELANYIEDKYQIPSNEAMNYAYIASGNMNEAILLLDEKNIDYSNILLDWLRISYKNDTVKLLEWINEFAKMGRERQKQFLKYSLHFFSELYHGHLISGYQFKLSEKEVLVAKKLMTIVDVDKITEIVSLLNSCFDNIMRNANPKILFMAESLKIHKLLLRYSNKNVERQQ
jgi:DNA polymerase-3 subunit delta'